jgi:Flp pilus assembly protein TadG
MRMFPKNPRRSGAVVVECAIIFPAMFLLTLGLLVGGLGVYRYNEVAHISHSTARFASVHGGAYEIENSTQIAAGTLPSVDNTYLQNYAANMAIACNPAYLTVTANCITRSGTNTWSVTNNGVTSGGNQDVISVTVTYAWYPELFLSGPINLTHTAVLPMSY